MAKAWPMDTILCCAAMVAGLQTTSIGWNTKSGLRSIRSYSAREPSAMLVTILNGWLVLRAPVRQPCSSSGRIASDTTSEWMPRSLRSVTYCSASCASLPRPTCSVEPSSMMPAM